MAVYTYEDFYKKAMESGLYEKGFSDADKALAKNNPDAGMSLLNAKLDWRKASTPEAKALANQRAENIRRQYGGYTAGEAGTGFFIDPLSPSSFNEEKPPEFSYDMETDPVYQAYKKQYAREGQRAAENTMGAASAASAGLPSSYAVTAAQQQGDYYASKMADKIPELFTDAHGRYLNELAQYNKDRDFSYGQHKDQIAHLENLDKQELNKAVTAATYGDYSLLEKIGIKKGDTDEWKYKVASLALQAKDYETLKQLLGIAAGKDADFDDRYRLAAAMAGKGDLSYLYQLIGQYF